jgi:CBS domain-containing protein
MIICPFCAADNIEGADSCDQCGQSLADADRTMPASEIERSVLKDLVSVLKPKAPITVTTTTSVIDVLRLLVDKKIGCALVVDGDELVGVFTERDSLMRIGTEVIELGDLPVSQFMTQRPQSLPLNARIAFAVRMMDLGGYRHIPVVDESEKAVGVISARDILRYFAEKLSSAAV